MVNKKACCLFEKTRGICKGLSLVVFFISLAACSNLGLQPTPSTSRPTPTFVRVFGQDDPRVGAKTTPGMPAVSDLFVLASPEVTPMFPLTPLASPTLAQATVNPYIRVTLTPAPGSQAAAGAGTANLSPNSPSENGPPTAQANMDILAGLSEFRLQYIYQDILWPGWGTQESWSVDYNLKETDFVYKGRNGLAVTPVEDYGGMFFSLVQAKSKPVLREDVAGVAFWVNSGDSLIYPDELAITVIGSNQHPYWVKDDASVQIDFKNQFFSETRLSLLGFHTRLEPDTWYQVILWLDELPYDPDYKYVTGFYIKNDVGFRQTYYIDDLSLILYTE